VLRTPLDAAGVAIYALTLCAVAVLTYRRPAYGIAALVFTVPFGLHRDVGATTLTLSKVALAGAFVGLACRRPAPGLPPGSAVRALALAGLAVAAATALSILQADYRGPALRETLKALEYVAFFGVAAIAAGRDPAEVPLRCAFAGSAALVSALALAQEFAGAPSVFRLDGHLIPRIAGPLEGPNQLSGYLGIALAVVGAEWIARRRDPGRSRALGTLEGLALLLGSTALVLTLSRAGVAAALVVMCLVAALSPAGARRKLGLVAVAASGALLGFAVLASVGDLGLLLHFSSLAEADDPGAVGTRSQLWHAALLLWRSHPLGIGAGNFEFELARAGYPALHTHANSLYLQSLTEGGPVLLAATLALVVLSLWAFVRGPFQAPLVVAALAASAGFALHQIVDFLVFYPKVGDLWWIVLALGAAKAGTRARARGLGAEKLT
jgi:O-antigen ligase